MLDQGITLGVFLVPLLASLTWLAHNNPKGYQRIFSIVSCLLLLVFLAAMVRFVTVEDIMRSVHEYIEPGRILAARETMQKLYWFSTWHVWLGMGLWAYLYFLVFLPEILSSSGSSESSKREG
jgi:Mn2+/Fe2+ NRAMP family transporter